MRTTRLAVQWLGIVCIGIASASSVANAQSRTAAPSGEYVEDEAPNRSVVRNRGSASRSTGPTLGAPTGRTATRSTTRTRQAPEAPELLQERSEEVIPRGPRTRTVPRDPGTPVPEGYAVDPERGELVEHPDHHADEFFDFDHVDCPICGGAGCDLCYGPRLSFLGGIYARGEYLAWNMRGMNVPPLVTTSPQGTLRSQAGVLGTPGVDVLFGGTTVNDSTRSGARVTLGMWLDECRKNAMELDYFVLSDGTDGFSQTSNGNPILARPFFNMLTAQESSELVAYPQVITGTVTVDTLTQFQGGGIRLRRVLCCGEDCGPSFFNPYPQPGAYRYEVLLGYRVVELNDQVNINENLTALSPTGTFLLNDQFASTNEFHGVDLGMSMQWRRGRWTADVISRVAFGNTRSTVSIRGNTQTNDGTGVNSYNGGLLAQRSNIGDYSANQFSVVPELGFMLGFDVTPSLRLFVGYSLIYWSNVVRAGDQIDLDLNPNLIPPEAAPFTGPLRPQFVFVETDFWVYGVNAGLELRF